MSDTDRFVEALQESNIIEYIGHDAEDGVIQMTFRVKLSKQWNRLLVNILLAGADGELFDLEPRKSYFVDDNRKPKYHWVLLVWGDLDEAYEDLRPFLSMRHEPKKVPVTKDPRLRPLPKRLRVIQDEDIEGNGRIRTVAPIPHSRGQRYSSEDETISTDTPDRKFKATVRRRGESERTMHKGGKSL